MTSRLAILPALLLAACGEGLFVEPRADRSDVTVRRYEDSRGNPIEDPNSLGFTYFADNDNGARHGAAGWNCLINDILLRDDDPDRIVRVVVHELLNVIALDQGYPADVGPDWYLWDGDSREPFYEMPAAEAAWVARSRRAYDIRVADEWLVDAVEKARERIAAASDGG